MKDLRNTFFAVMYHYIRPFEDSNLKYLSIEDFEKQLDYFSEQFGIVDAAGWELFRKGGYPSGVLLTFDDGLKDHIQYVLPILKKRNLFGIFYCCSDPLEGKSLTVHLTHYLLAYFDRDDIWEHLKHVGLVEAYYQAKSLSTDVAYRHQVAPFLEKEIKRVFNWCRFDPYQQERLLEVFKHFFHLDNSQFVGSWNLSIQDIENLWQSGMEIGSHTCSHRLLSNLDPQIQVSELTDSKEILNSVVGNTVKSFCFPYGGKNSYTKQTLDMLDRLGYSESFSVESQTMPYSDGTYQERFELPRFDCNYFPHGKTQTLGEGLMKKEPMT
jgi:peptidoglycan/xylan/chitin deacetylase (PgdA/CDA1 family)